MTITSNLNGYVSVVGLRKDMHDSNGTNPVP